MQDNVHKTEIVDVHTVMKEETMIEDIQIIVIIVLVEITEIIVIIEIPEITEITEIIEETNIRGIFLINYK